MMMNPAYRVRPDDVDEDDIDPLDLAPLESSLAPIVTIPVEAEEEYLNKQNAFNQNPRTLHCPRASNLSKIK